MPTAQPIEYATPQPRRNSRLVVVSMYLLPLGLSLLFWVLQDSSRWAGGARPLGMRLLVGLWQATGPFAWLLMGAFRAAPILVVFALAWGGWIGVVLTSRLREKPYAFHFVASCLWCVSGCPPSGLVIT